MWKGVGTKRPRDDDNPADRSASLLVLVIDCDATGILDRVTSRPIDIVALAAERDDERRRGVAPARLPSVVSLREVEGLMRVEIVERYIRTVHLAPRPPLHVCLSRAASLAARGARAYQPGDHHGGDAHTPLVRR